MHVRLILKVWYVPGFFLFIVFISFLKYLMFVIFSPSKYLLWYLVLYYFSKSVQLCKLASGPTKTASTLFWPQVACSSVPAS